MHLLLSCAATYFEIVYEIPFTLLYFFDSTSNYFKYILVFEKPRSVNSFRRYTL